MKAYRQNIILLGCLAVLSFSRGYAADGDAHILSDNKLATIKGGYCLFFRCPGPPGQGKCQPIGNDAYDLCQHISCSLTEDIEGNTEVLECKVKGASPETCSEATTYIACIQTRFPATCLQSGDDSVCGTRTDTYCFPDTRNRQCFCDTGGGVLPCDWVDCAD